MYSQTRPFSLALIGISLFSYALATPVPQTPSSTVAVAVTTATGVNLNILGFGAAIEAAAVNTAGEIFAADFEGGGEAPSTAFGVLFPSNSSIQNPVFVALNDTGKTPLLAGGRFLNDGRILLADATNQRVLAFTPSNKDLNTFCADTRMLQPNDLAISTTRDCLIFLSGQNFTADTTAGKSGDLWTCDGGLAIQFPPDILAAAGIHRTNGIETSPDGSALYLSSATNVNGTVTKNSIFKFALNQDTGYLLPQAPSLFFDFVDTAATDVDGMRTDVNGSLFVTRNGLGSITKLSPDGKLLLEIELPGMGGPSNLEFGGGDGKTLVAIGKCSANATQGCAASFESDGVGKAFARLQEGTYDR